MRLTFRPQDNCYIVKQTDSISLVKDKIHPMYSIYRGQKIIADCGQENAYKWFQKYVAVEDMPPSSKVIT